MIKSGMLIVISGPSGVGKDTVVNAFMEGNHNCMLSVSATTRGPRPGEIDGIHYHYLTREQFEDSIVTEKMLEYAEYGGNYYGTPKNIVLKERDSGKHVILIIETEGGKQIRKLCPDAVFIFLMPPSLEELQSRLMQRGAESDDMIRQRLDIAYGEIEEGQSYDYVVVNKELEKTIETLSAIVTAAECSPMHNPDLLKGVCSV